VLRENFPRFIGVFGKGRSAGLKLRPCVIESGNKNLYFLREEHPGGKSLDKVMHRSSTEWVAQAAAERTKSQEPKVLCLTPDSIRAFFRKSAERGELALIFVGASPVACRAA
jgi:hypothetical protein